MKRHQTALMALPNGQSSGLRKLDEIVEREITEDDLKTIAQTFVAKAKAGHEPSARFVIDYLLGGKKTPTAITVNHFHGDDDERTTIGHVARDATPLEQVSIYLTHVGYATPKLIAADTGLEESAVIRVLDDHPERFRVNGMRYSLVN